MNGKKKNNVDFKNLTPQIQIKKVKFSETYRKSLLEEKGRAESGFSENTTARD